MIEETLKFLEKECKYISIVPVKDNMFCITGYLRDVDIYYHNKTIKDCLLGLAELVKIQVKKC